MQNEWKLARLTVDHLLKCALYIQAVVAVATTTEECAALDLPREAISGARYGKIGFDDLSQFGGELGDPQRRVSPASPRNRAIPEPDIQ
jgi:hypothetical protein